MRILAIPMDIYAASVQLGPVRAIVTGKRFKRLSASERAAALAHEAGHIHLRHTTQRLVWLVKPSSWADPEAWAARVRQQEFEADDFTVRSGHAQGLLTLLDRFARIPHNSPLHPTPKARIERIVAGLMKSQLGEPCHGK